MSDVERVKELADDLAALSTKIADKHLYDREQKILRELANLALKLAQRVEELENPWVSVKDRLPECDHAYILTRWDDGEIALWSSCKLAGGKDYVTHWMPLPQPPKDTP